ncbi:hypothetical protein [Alkalihalobacillus sp. BA299]|uniref:TcaA NTF2-like domain-containing protein n=1 Tax=Alkalihalobacillus sp. BA299 TaxID=2815938 RepID=UPI001ADC18F9|nr:hypothetical protein [Alkalihalobacillus sp. BA299]
MKKMIIVLLSSFTLILLLTGCGNTEEGTFSPVSGEKKQSAIQFVNEYKEDMVFHVNQGSFGELEPYLVPNSTFYHLLRHHVNDLQQDRSTIKLVQHSVNEVLVNEFEEYHVNVHEIIETTDRRGDKMVEEMDITYELIEHNDIFKIVTIMKR